MRRIDMRALSLSHSRWLRRANGLNHRLDRGGDALLVKLPDHVAHARVFTLEGLEVRSSQLENLRPVKTRDRRRARLPGQQRDLTEEISLLELSELNGLTLRSKGRDFHATLAEDEEGDAGIPFTHQDTSRHEGVVSEPPDDATQFIGVEVGEERRLSDAPHGRGGRAPRGWGGGGVLF